MLVQTHPLVADPGRIEPTSIGIQRLPYDVCRAVAHRLVRQRRRFRARLLAPRRRVRWQGPVRFASDWQP